MQILDKEVKNMDAYSLYFQKNIENWKENFTQLSDDDLKKLTTKRLGCTVSVNIIYVV